MTIMNAYRNSMRGPVLDLRSNRECNPADDLPPNSGLNQRFDPKSDSISDLTLDPRPDLTPEEKALLLAKHRREEAEARDRMKERKARTRRLIQEGAILENVAPWVRDMEPEQLTRELKCRLRR